jgi:glycogen synthase
MAKYQITATIEIINVANNDIKLQLKGCGKYAFEYEDNNKQKIVCNILEHITNKIDSKFLDPSNDFHINIKNNRDIASNLLSHANIENKRLKFEIDFDSKTKKYNITSISKAD